MLLLAASLQTGLLEPALAASTSPVPLVLLPCDAHGHTFPGQEYFQLTARPGSWQRLYALIGNRGRQAVTVSIAALDAASGLNGGLSFSLPQQPRRHVGSWIQVKRSRVSIAPGKGVVVPFAVHVPRRTAPRQYAGGLSAYIPVKTSGGSGFHVTINVQYRLVLTVAVTVPGPLYQRFTIGKVSLARQPGGASLVVHVKNSGTMFLHGAGHLWFYRYGQRRPVVSAPLVIQTTVPHTVVHYPIFWTRLPKPGRYWYRVQVWWGTRGRTQQRGQLVVNAR